MKTIETAVICHVCIRRGCHDTSHPLRADATLYDLTVAERDLADASASLDAAGLGGVEEAAYSEARERWVLALCAHHGAE